MVLPFIPIIIAIILFVAVFGFGIFQFFMTAITLFLISSSCLAIGSGWWYYNKLQAEKEQPINDMEDVTTTSEGIIVDGETIVLPPDEATIVDAGSNDIAIDTIVDELVQEDTEIQAFLKYFGIGNTVEGFGSGIIDVMPYCSSTNESKLPILYNERLSPYC